MKYYKEKQYTIFNDWGSSEIYAKKINGFVRIFVKENGQESLLLEDDFIGLKKLSTEGDFVYYLLRNKYDMYSIMDFPFCNLIKSFPKSHIKRAYRREFFNGGYKKDVVFVLWDKENKIYSIWSMFEGYLFKPYNYIEVIDRYTCGVLLDNKIIVEDNGYSFDISPYKEIGNGIYYNQVKDNYLYQLDEYETKTIFVDLHPDICDDDILKNDDYIWHVIFNKKTKQVTIEQSNDDYETDWSQYNDVAYDGYSRLELGLDD